MESASVERWRLEPAAPLRFDENPRTAPGTPVSVLAVGFPAIGRFVIALLSLAISFGAFIGGGRRRSRI